MCLLNRYFTSKTFCNGLNIRIGQSDDRNIFAEFISYSDFSPVKEHHYSINLGGCIKFKKKHFISLGFQFNFDKRFSLQKVTPVYNFNFGF